MSDASRDPCARAMAALDAELVLPAELEEAMLEAVSEARAAVEPEDVRLARPSARRRDAAPARRGSMFAVVAAIAASVAGVAVGGSAWLAERRAPIEASAASADAAAAAEGAARDVAAIDWGDPTPWREKMVRLEALRVRMEALADPAAVAKVAPRYADGVRRGFLDAGKASLERALAVGTGAWTLEERANLKAYLFLGDPARLGAEEAWEVARVTSTSAETIAARGRVDVGEVEPLVAPHAATYLRMVGRGLVRGPELDAALVARTREVLAHAEPRRYYDVFVTPLLEGTRDADAPAGGDGGYPSITLDAALGARDAQPLLSSRSRASWGTPYEVLGVYTRPARAALFRALEAARDELGRDAWVVGEAGADLRTREALDRVRDDYDGLYVHEWESFLRDVEVARPLPGRDGARALRALAEADGPLVRLLRVVADHSRPVAAPVGLADGDPVARRFAAFGRFLAADGGVAGYRAIVAALAEDAEAGRRRDGREAARQVRELLAGGGADEDGRDLLAALLLAPLEAPAR